MPAATNHAPGTSTSPPSSQDEEEGEGEGAPLLHVTHMPPTLADAPLYAYPLLAASVIAVSSAGAVFISMAEVSPVTLAAWRLQLTTVLLVPGGIVQLRSLPHAQQYQCISSVCCW